MKPLNRRTFLRSAGICLALPFLDAMIPVGWAAAARAQAAKRLVCIGNPFGMIPERFFPTGSGANYTLPRSCNPISASARFYDLFQSGPRCNRRTPHRPYIFERHPNQRRQNDARRQHQHRSKSAEFVGVNTRFPSLNVSINGHCEMSWTRTGVRVPPINNPQKVFQALFVDTTAKEKEQRAIALEQHGSILDAVMGEARSFERKLGQRDREKLEEYLTSVRTVEKKLGMSQGVAGQTQTPGQYGNA